MSFHETKIMRLFSASARGKHSEENKVSSPLNTAILGQSGSKFFSPAEVHPLQAPTGACAMEMSPWTLSICDVHTCTAACHAKILSRAFTRELLCSNSFAIVTKAAEGMALPPTSDKTSNSWLNWQT